MNKISYKAASDMTDIMIGGNDAIGDQESACWVSTAREEGGEGKRLKEKEWSVAQTVQETQNSSLSNPYK